MAMEKLGASDPQRIGAYRLLARLGAGGMGQVYLARSDRGRTVAVKLVRRELAEQEEFRSRFRQEVQAARRVGGRWTAPVLDANTEAEVPWVATGYVAGPTLQQVVSGGHGPLPERSVLVLAAGLTHALQDIHAAGLIHRDLKPSNVLVTIDGPRVIDFGIARALETVTDSGLTRTGALVGSPGFMAPEQIRGDRVTAACDVFCLGSVLSYAATGKLPFGTSHSGVHALMFRIAQEPPDLTDVPESLHDLIRDCLQKPPASRPTLDQLLTRTGPGPTPGDPWLPAALVAQLGIHAVQLLDLENPTTSFATNALPSAAPQDAPTPPDDSAAPAAAHPPAEPAPAPDPDPVVTDPPEAASTGTPPPPGTPHHPAGGSDSAGVHAMPTYVVPTQPPAPGPAPGPGPGPVPGQHHAGLPALPPANPNPAPHAYGYPNTPPPYGNYGYPQGTGQSASQGPGHSPQDPYGYPTPPGGYGYQPTHTPEPPPRSKRSTIALVAVALVVALGAGGSVYAFMRGTDSDSSSSARPTTDNSPAAQGTAPGSGTPSDPKNPETPSDPGSSTTPTDDTAAGSVPSGFLGTWHGTVVDSTRDLTLKQGKTGDIVMSLSADGPGGSFHCLFEAELTGVTGTDGPVHLGDSRVVQGPEASCRPGLTSEVILLPDGRLKRTSADGKSVTYTKSY